MNPNAPPQPATVPPVVKLAERVQLLQEQVLKAGFGPSADPEAEKAFMDDLSGGI